MIAFIISGCLFFHLLRCIFEYKGVNLVLDEMEEEQVQKNKDKAEVMVVEVGVEMVTEMEYDLKDQYPEL